MLLFYLTISLKIFAQVKLLHGVFVTEIFFFNDNIEFVF